MAKGQPLKLQPSMLRDSNWMRVFNSIVPNITMIPNGGNRSKLGIDILNKQGPGVFKWTRARQLKFYPMKLYTDTKARWRKISNQYSTILSTSSCTICDKNNPILPNLSSLSTNNPWFFWLLGGGLSEHTIVFCTISSTRSSHPSHKAFASTKKTEFWFPFRVFFPYRLRQGTIIFLPPHRLKTPKFNPFRYNSSSKSTQNNLRQF